ncbi:hypothetical protein [Clostridium baratii]|uniref:Lipoprotein n=1 Tax=Clostridium baratii TaxID=1561 RepID=A0A174V9L5_9CLOT|nr:hypothetical protein [Clostridium baratii]CUQ28735.1 Uncharacterised protein [Clostridium baratii]
MRNKRRVLYSFLILGILILYPIYTFVGCGNENSNNKNVKIEDKDTSKEYVNKQDEENKNTSKENANNELDKNIKNEDNKQKVSNNNKKSVVNDDTRKVVTPKESNKGIKSESQLSNKKEQTKTVSSKFTSKDAVIACEKKYGKDSDTIYSCSENMSNVNGEKGYLVQVKSKELMKQGGNGVAFTVLVTPSGKIIEL